MYDLRNLLNPQTAMSAATNDRQFIVIVFKMLATAFCFNATPLIHAEIKIDVEIPVS